jgi:membrane protease YdiL (CAAX protease family)
VTAPLDERVTVLSAEPGRTWGVADAVAAVLAVPAVVALSLLALAAVPEVPEAAATAVATVLLGALTVLVVRRPARQSGGAERALGLGLPEWRDTGRVVLWSLLLLLAQAVSVALLAAAVPRLRDVPVDNASFLREEPPLALIAIVLAAVLLAPVIEEVLFRGVVLQGLMPRLGFWPAAVLSSLCFGLFHATGTGLEAVPIVVATGVFGLGLCLLVRRTGRLGPGIGVHALRNALAIGVVVLGG